MALSNQRPINETLVTVADKGQAFHLHSNSIEGLLRAYKSLCAESVDINTTRTQFITMAKVISGETYSSLQASTVEAKIDDEDDGEVYLDDEREEDNSSLEILKKPVAKSYWVGNTIRATKKEFFAALQPNQRLQPSVKLLQFDKEKNVSSILIWFAKNEILCSVHFAVSSSGTIVYFKWAGSRTNILNAVDSPEGEQKFLEETLSNNFEHFYIPRPEKQKGALCYLIGVDGRGSLDLIELNKLITDIDEETLLLSYPDAEHDKIEEFLDKGVDNKGKLLLMHGKPGTGKTTYLRYLLSNKYDGEVVFMNASIFSQITSVNFVSFAVRYLQNKLVVIEDAESLLVARDDDHKERTTSISDLLNFTDGLVGDALNIKVIATFNTSVDEIDGALLRKGRLFHRQMFDNLSFEQALTLLMKLTSGTRPNEQAACSKELRALKKETYSLADIYGTMAE